MLYGRMKKCTAQEIAEAHPFCTAGMAGLTEQLKESIRKDRWKPWSSICAIQAEDRLHLVTASHRSQALRDLIAEGDDLSDISIPTLVFDLAAISQFLKDHDFRMLVRHIYNESKRFDVAVETKCVGIELRRLLDLPILARTCLYNEREFADTFPALENLMHNYSIHCREVAGRKASHPWEVAMAIFWSELKGKRILECGARNSFFGSFATQYTTREVHVIDYFQGWKEFGGPEIWFDLWVKTAINPKAIFCSKMDMRSLDFPDNYFDIVASFSAVEHSPDDIKSMTEIARVVKPGGKVIISTDFALSYDPVPHCRIYTLDKFFERLIGPSGLKLDERFNLDVQSHSTPNAKYIPGIAFFTK